MPGTEVGIRRDPLTGDVVLSAKPDSWGEFFAAADAADIPPDFMTERDTSAPPERNL
jgi:antitoxin VapB